MNLLIDILRGSYKQEIQQRGFHDIKTYGVGRDVPFSHWRHYITQLINQGIIAIDFADFSRLKSTPLSVGVLKGDTNVELAKYVAPDKKKKVIIPKIQADLSQLDKSLLDNLKVWRRTAAKAQKVPAYLIMHDKTLKQIAALKPDTDAKLLSVDGIGKAKLDKYGAAIIGLVAGQN